MDHSDHTLLQAGNQTAISDRMRELLARAAQDHVYEQRTQGAVLDEIRQRLEGMEWLLREVRERELCALSDAVEAVSGRLGEFATRPPAWAEGLAQHVEIVRDRVDGVANRVAGLGDRVEAVGDRVKPIAELSGLWADLGTVRDGVTEALKRLQGVLDGTQGLPERLAEFARRLDRLTSGMEAAGGRFSRVDKALLDLTNRTERVEGGVLDLAENLEGTLASAIQRLTGSVEQLAAKVDGMTAELAESETRLGDRLDGVDSHLGAVKGRLDTVDVRLKSLDGRVETTDSRLTGLDGVNGRLAEVGTRLTGLDQRFTGIDGALSRQDERFATLEGNFEDVNERLDVVDDRVEAVNQRLGQLPALLEVGEVHKRVGELIDAQGDDQGRRFDEIDQRLGETAASLPRLAELIELVRSRPDRDQLSATVDEVIQPARDDLTRRLGALEETMLALAEALLRPTRPVKE